jgi:hypothetical protein
MQLVRSQGENQRSELGRDLADIVIHAGLQALFAITFHCIGCNCNDWSPLVRSWHQPDLLRGLIDMDICMVASSKPTLRVHTVLC